MADTTPWLTGLTVIGWCETGGTKVYYPVNDAPPYNPLRYDIAPGRRWVGSVLRQQNRYTGAGTAVASFNIDLTGLAASDADWYAADLMNACGLTQADTGTGRSYTLSNPQTGAGNVIRADMAVVFNDASSDMTTLHLTNCVGGATFTFRGGEIPNVTYDMVGILYTPGVSAAMPTVTTPPFGQAITGATFTLASTTFVLREAVISTGPAIAMRRSVAGFAGYAVPVITGYECTASLLVELDNSGKDFESYFRSATLADDDLAFALSGIPAGGVGSHSTGDVIAATGTFRLDGFPQREDDGEGIMCLRIPLTLNTLSATSFSLVWS